MTHFRLTFSTSWPWTADSLQFFFNLPSQEVLRWIEQNFMWVLLRVHDGFWKIVSAQLHLTVLFWRVQTFLPFSFFFKIFQNLPKSTMKPWAKVFLDSYCYCRARRWREFIFFALCPLKLKKCSKEKDFNKHLDV